MGKKEEIIKGLVNELGFIIKESVITSDELGGNELELKLDCRMAPKYIDRLKLEIRSALKLEDCPRIESYPKEVLLYPICIDLYN